MTVVVSLHDVGPTTIGECSELLQWAEEWGIHLSLLVVPGPWRGPVLRPGSAFAATLRVAASRGHEIAVHGWEHTSVTPPATPLPARLRARVIARGCAEFAHLDRTEARRRAGAGLRVLRSLGCDPTGFVPPGWLLSEAATRGLRDAGFDYTMTRSLVIDLRRGRSVRVPAYCQRPGSILTGLGSKVVEVLVDRQIRERRLVRLALHPADTHGAALRSATRRVLARAATAPTCTYGELVARVRADQTGDRFAGVTSGRT